MKQRYINQPALPPSSPFLGSSPASKPKKTIQNAEFSKKMQIPAKKSLPTSWIFHFLGFEQIDGAIRLSSLPAEYHSLNMIFALGESNILFPVGYGERAEISRFLLYLFVHRLELKTLKHRRKTVL